uniref:Uncharacterized protein n=1 Tax=Haemonchus contortus TaxID=6289 RepID=A0A7I4Z5I4_HAECO
MGGKKRPEPDPRRAYAAKEEEVLRRYLGENSRWRQQQLRQLSLEELSRYQLENAEFAAVIGRFLKTLYDLGREQVEGRADVQAILAIYYRERRDHEAKREALLAEARNINSANRSGNSNNEPGSSQNLGRPGYSAIRSLLEEMKAFKDKMKGLLEQLEGIAPPDPIPSVTEANTPSTSRGTEQLAKPKNSNGGSPDKI